MMILWWQPDALNCAGVVIGGREEDEEQEEEYHDTMISID